MALTAAITASSSGDNVIVAAVTGKCVRVLGYVLSFSGTVNAKWRDDSSADISGLLYGVADTVVAAPVTPPLGGSQLGWMRTSQGNALKLNLSAAVAVGGHVLYDLVS